MSAEFCILLLKKANVSNRYANNAGYTKKTVCYAISYIGYSVGNLIGRRRQCDAEA